jgi:hypothetical protein
MGRSWIWYAWQAVTLTALTLGVAFLISVS